MNQPKVVKPLTQETINWIHRFFQRTSIPRMSEEKINRILEREKQANKEAI